MKRNVPKFLKHIVSPLLAAAGLMLFWFLLSLAVGKELIIPSPAATLEKLFALFTEKSFYLSLGGTLLRSIESFALSVAIATVLALLSVRVKTIYLLLRPIVMIAGTVPTMSVKLLSVIWLKPAFSPIFIAVLIACPMLYNMLYQSLKSIDVKLKEMSDVYKVPKRVQLGKFYLPAVAPDFLAGMSATSALNVKIVISAEVLASTANSIGQMMYVDKLYLETASLLAWTIVAVLLGCAFDGLFRAIKYWIVRWDR